MEIPATSASSPMASAFLILRIPTGKVQGDHINGRIGRALDDACHIAGQRINTAYLKDIDQHRQRGASGNRTKDHHRPDFLRDIRNMGSQCTAQYIHQSTLPQKRDCTHHGKQRGINIQKQLHPILDTLGKGMVRIDTTKQCDGDDDQYKDW